MTLSQIGKYNLPIWDKMKDNLHKLYLDLVYYYNTIYSVIIENDKL